MANAAAARWPERLWYGGSPLAGLLLPLAWLFGVAVYLRRLAYRRGWIAATRLSIPVVVVGNITTGGTGKTPLVEWLVRQLQAEGLRPGIAARGYGAPVRGGPVLVAHDSRAADVGDEPLLLARRTGVPVCVCRDRARAARALAERGADIVVADDGLQHYRLARDVEIAVVDGERGLGNGWLLPAGPLREPPGRLREVDMVLCNGGDNRQGAARFTLLSGDAVNLASGEARPLAAFARQDVWAVAGIGNPTRFYAELRRHGIEPVPVPVPDHGRTDLAALRRNHPRPILMTEKDAVKYAAGSDLAAWYVPVQVSMAPEIAAAVMARIRPLLTRPRRASAPGDKLA